MKEFDNRVKEYFEKDSIAIKDDIDKMSQFASDLKGERIIHFTHIDSDAVGCAVSLNTFSDNIEETIYCETTKAQEQLDKFLSENSYPSEYYVAVFSDIGFTDIEEIKESVGFFKRVYFIDHHKTNKMMDEEVRNSFPENCYFLMKTEINDKMVSAAYLLGLLVYNYNKDVDEKILTEWMDFLFEISNYDTYNFKNRDDLPRSFNEDVTSNVISAKKWVEAGTELPDLLKEISDMFSRNIFSGTYRYTLPNLTQCFLTSFLIHRVSSLKLFTKNIRTVEFDDSIPELSGFKTNIIAVDKCEFSNSLFEVMYKSGVNSNNALILFKENKVVSFRSAIGGMDVSRLAVNLGGGGHEHAAGAHLDNNEDLFNKILTVYEEAPELTEEAVYRFNIKIEELFVLKMRLC